MTTKITLFPFIAIHVALSVCAFPPKRTDKGYGTTPNRV